MRLLPTTVHLEYYFVAIKQYTIDDFRWDEYKGWSILVFTEMESH
jgi:hypothetical protein